MNSLEIRRIAKSHGINPTGMAKVDLIRAIQEAEGVTVCFGSPEAEYCDEEGCLWWEECYSRAFPHRVAV